MVTLPDIVKEANVSKTTVSRVINHPERVTPELSVPVERVMTKLDCHPSSTARALVDSRTNIVKFATLGDIDITEPCYVNSLFSAACGPKAGSRVTQSATDINQIQKGNAGGYTTTRTRECNYLIFDKLEKPFIFFDETLSSFDFTGTDDRYDTAVATKHALVRGYKNAIFIGIDVKEGFEYAREYGYSISM